MVTNSGDVPISDIRLTWNAPEAFSFSPTTFDIVDPGTHADALSLVRLSVVHGIESDGRDSAILAQGRYRITVFIEGVLKKGDGISEEPVKYRSAIELVALVTDVSAFDQDGPINLRRPIASSWLGGFEADGFVHLFYKRGQVDLVNSGNTPVEAAIISIDGSRVENERTLAPGDTLVMPADSTGYFRINGGQAVRDKGKLPLYANGNSYLLFRSNEDKPGS
jgi:hypothetical protein